MARLLVYDAYENKVYTYGNLRENDPMPYSTGTTLRRGSRGCYVMILQDALSTLGYQTGSRIDGLFGARTEEALRGYQRRTSLRVDGVCGCNSWKKITTAVLGVGRTRTTID